MSEQAEYKELARTEKDKSGRGCKPDLWGGQAGPRLGNANRGMGVGTAKIVPLSSGHAEWVRRVTSSRRQRHPDQLWDSPHACTCDGARAPCPACNPSKPPSYRGSRRASSPTKGTVACSRMCNLYSITTNQEAIIRLLRVVNCYVGNLAPMPGVLRHLRPAGCTAPSHHATNLHCLSRRSATVSLWAMATFNKFLA